MRTDRTIATPLRRRLRLPSQRSQYGLYGCCSIRCCCLMAILLALTMEWTSASHSSDSSLSSPAKILLSTGWRGPTQRLGRDNQPEAADDPVCAMERIPTTTGSSTWGRLSTNRWRAGASVVVPSSSAMSTATGFSYYSRVALAGGLAGATGTTVLYPMDSAKTLRQSNPAKFSSVRQALWHMIRLPAATTPHGGSTTTGSTTWQFSKAYRGWLPAALGAIPSSALYFGAYETSKRALEQRFGTHDNADGDHHRWWIHGLAAASGNTISSAVFVPKEVLKQQLQYQTSASSSSFPKVFMEIVRQKGVRGLYAGYQATLMRNIPSAMVRFVLYEELKRIWTPSSSAPNKNNSGDRSRVRQILLRIPAPVGLFAAGAVAGATASGIMTPVDVIKTRLATGTCPVGVQNCFRHVLREMGWQGLYAGAQSRMMWSGAFSAIGFGTFELVKGALGVADSPADVVVATTTPPSKRQTT